MYAAPLEQILYLPAIPLLAELRDPGLEEQKAVTAPAKYYPEKIALADGSFIRFWRHSSLTQLEMLVRLVESYHKKEGDLGVWTPKRK